MTTLTKQSTGAKTSFSILGLISMAHLLNDMIQSLILAIYPILRGEFALNFIQIGFITLIYQTTASLFQPIIGFYTDKKPKPYSLPIGMCFTLTGLLLLSNASHYSMVLVAAALVGIGSAVFHPESSRIARLASGGRHGLAQSIFQVGGYLGSSLGPLFAALFIASHSIANLAWFSLGALLAIIVLLQISRWYSQQHYLQSSHLVVHNTSPLTKQNAVIALVILLFLTFTKFFYVTSLSNYYTFYLIHHFHVSIKHAQFYLFAFLFAVAAGTMFGGPLTDYIGKKKVIWFSILGVAPFTLLLPHASLYWTGVLSVIIGLIIASAFSAIVIYAQELIPNRIGMVSGLFFGFAFGIGGVAAAVLGYVADLSSIEFVYSLCAYFPLLGVVTVFLPNLEKNTITQTNSE